MGSAAEEIQPGQNVIQLNGNTGARPPACVLAISHAQTASSRPVLSADPYPDP